MILPYRTTLLAALLAAALPLSAQTLDDARVLHDQGRLQESAAAFRAIAASTARTNPSAAATARNNACVVLDEMGDFAGALTECEAALRVRRALRDPARIARTLSATGIVLGHLGDFDEAEARLREALELHRLSRDTAGQAADLTELARVAAARGRFNRALDSFGAAASLAAEYAAEPWAPAQLHLSRTGQAMVFAKLGAYGEALRLYEEALADDALLDPRHRASLRIDLGAVRRDLGQPQEALAALRDAAAISSAAGDPAGLAAAWLQAGLVHHLALRQPRAAEAAYRTALRFARRGGDRDDRETEIEALFYLGRLRLEERRPDEAEAIFSQAFALARNGGSPAARWSTLEGLGRAAMARGRDAEALAFLRQAMDEIDKAGVGHRQVRRSSPGPGLFGEKRPVYDAAVELLARMAGGGDPEGHHSEEALAVVQRAKVRDLLDSLGGSGRALEALGTDALQEKAGHGVLLEYFLGERDLFRWIVRGNGAVMTDLGPSAPILADVAAVHDSLAAGREPDAARLARLSRALLGPPRQTDLGGGLLRIAPDGALRYLPFELLADPSDPERTIADRATSYLPAGSALGWLRQLDDFAAVYNLLAFGSPVFPAGSAAAGLVRRENLPRLPGAATAVREMSALADALPGRHDLFAGADATEANFRASVLNGAGVIHLATHALIDEWPGRGPVLFFSPRGEDDGLFYPEEIATLEDRTDLTVLAGCRTAPGTENGDALNALTGSFLAGGSPAVLVTLWNLPEGDNTVFLERLYRELGKGRQPSEALRRTRLALRADPHWRQSGRWAAYVLTGDSPEVAYSHLPRYLLGAALLAALALAPWLLDRKG